nr:MAG TPA: hypothetical protein [Caudoviricetes sp.]
MLLYQFRIENKKKYPQNGGIFFISFYLPP